jgi:hypothetical protein
MIPSDPTRDSRFHTTSTNLSRPSKDNFSSRSKRNYASPLLVSSFREKGMFCFSAPLKCYLEAGTNICKITAIKHDDLQRRVSGRTLSSQAELALVAQSRDDFKAQLMKLALPPSTPPCYFLEMIPIEIRNQIYGELLLNPILDTVESVNGGDPESVEYHLSASILSTCRQVHQKASDILFGRNTFSIVCMRESYYDSSPVPR